MGGYRGRRCTCSCCVRATVALNISAVAIAGFAVVHSGSKYPRKVKEVGVHRRREGRVEGQPRGGGNKDN